MANAQIGIVGGGLAGALTALKLIRATTEGIDITLIGSDPEIGRGIAYSTRNPSHLVNGPAKNFGVEPQQPDHLARWLQSHAAALGWQPPPGVAFADSFPPRWIYGTYVQHQLEQAIAQNAGRVGFRHVPDRVVGLRRHAQGYGIVTQSGAAIAVGQVVLATGLFRKSATEPAEGARGARPSIHDPWHDQAYDGIDRDREVLVVGTGLSALDVILSAEDAGFKGRYIAISRRGLLVQERLDLTAWPDVLDPQDLPTQLSQVVAAARRARRSIRQNDGHLHQIAGAIRPHLPELWERATLREKRQFIRHLRPFWENILHRAAPVSVERLQAIQRAGRFTQVSGRLTGLDRAEDGSLAVQWTPRGSQVTRTVRADRVIGADGFEFDWRKVSDPLVKDLLAQGLVHPDDTGFGIAAHGASGQVLDSAGQGVDGLYAVGHPLRGVNWESNSIGEQLAGAIRTAEFIASRTASGGVRAELEASQ